MRISHKPLNKQVVFITGASSGIGRQSAMRFAKAGAKVIAVSRSEEGLKSLVQDIERNGGEAVYSVADVANIDALRKAADTGVAKFGPIHTWVNNAGVGMYTRLLYTDVADDRRLFETNFWGIVNGSRLAAEYLKSAGGGALINLGSEVSDVSIPTQGMYSTSKHAVMGFTDALRDEIMEDKLPITVTLIKPAAINTPFARHAQNNLDQDATLPSPVYAVDLVADQILHAAEHGGRELYVGGGGRLLAFLGNHFPDVMDWIASTFMSSQQLAKRPANHAYEGLYESRGFYSSKGDVDRDRHVQKVSLYGIARRHPWTTALILAVVGFTTLGLVGKAAVDD